MRLFGVVNERAHIIRAGIFVVVFDILVRLWYLLPPDQMLPIDQVAKNIIKLF